MAPSGDFIVLEAKELVKHFTAEGLPKNPDQLQVLKPAKKSLNAMDENDLKKCRLECDGDGFDHFEDSATFGRSQRETAT